MTVAALQEKEEQAELPNKTGLLAAPAIPGPWNAFY
jgi:hypothetical protein